MTSGKPEYAIQNAKYKNHNTEHNTYAFVSGSCTCRAGIHNAKCKIHFRECRIHIFEHGKCTCRAGIHIGFSSSHQLSSSQSNASAWNKFILENYVNLVNSVNLILQNGWSFLHCCWIECFRFCLHLENGVFEVSFNPLHALNALLTGVPAPNQSFLKVLVPKKTKVGILLSSFGGSWRPHKTIFKSIDP